MSASSKPSGPIHISPAGKMGIYRDASGVLKAKIEDKEEAFSVKPIRCFPFTAADNYVGLYKVEADGSIEEEMAIISDLNKLNEDYRKLIKEELSKSQPLIKITRIYSIKRSPEKVWEWDADTDKGRQTFTAASLRYNIYIIGPSLVIVKDTQANNFFVNPAELDYKSLCLLEMCI